jgi:hypothetical protein
VREASDTPNDVAHITKNIPKTWRNRFIVYETLVSIGCFAAEKDARSAGP